MPRYGRFPMGRFPGRMGRRGRRGGRFRLWPIALFALFGLFYFFSNSETVEITGRRQIVDISEDQEITLGLNSYNQILNQSDVVPHGREVDLVNDCLLYTSPSPRDRQKSRMPSSA